MIESIRNVLPLWAVALVMAAAAPWLVRTFAGSLEARARKRALVVVSRAELRRKKRSPSS
jgi:hypothetical protein